jgi:dienelactone hydrolase
VPKNKVTPKNKKGKDHSKNNLLIIGLIVAAFILIAIAYYYVSTHPGANTGVTNAQWSLDASGHLTFPEARGPVEANSTVVESTANYTREEVNYTSFGDQVYASLCIPKNVTRPPVIIVLPAATINKETDFGMAESLNDMGYASLTLDERGNNGETGGMFAGNWTDGFDSYTAGGTPTQYKQIYDVLRALDYVKSRSDLDGNNVAILGESIGGMWSIITAAEDSQFKGVICVSSSGFNFPVYDNSTQANIEANRFLGSMQPSNYLSLLPPRKLVMIHFTNDTTIPISDAKALYANASQPKAFYEYDGDLHGLANLTYMPDLHRELQGMLGR